MLLNNIRFKKKYHYKFVYNNKYYNGVFIKKSKILIRMRYIFDTFTINVLPTNHINILNKEVTQLEEFNTYEKNVFTDSDSDNLSSNETEYENDNDNNSTIKKSLSLDINAIELSNDDMDDCVFIDLDSELRDYKNNEIEHDYEFL